MKKRNMRKLIYALLFAAAIISATSCITDEKWEDDPRDTTGEVTDVVLHLKTPDGFSAPRTRMYYQQENTIDNVYVLVFDKTGKLVDVKVGEVTQNNTMTSPGGGYSGTGSFKVTLPPSKGNATSKLVVLANAESILETLGYINATSHLYTDLNKGADYASVIASITTGFTTKYSANSIPMWGETGQIEIKPSNVNQTVILTRALARIDVGVGADPEATQTDGTPWVWDGTNGSDDIPFRLDEVYVFRANNQYALIPNGAPTAVGGKHNYGNTTEINLFRFTNIFTNDNGERLYITQQIYVPEADVKMGGTLRDENHTNRMAIVVGGRYDADDNGFDEDISYYRLDFAKSGNLMNVLRNHYYQFNISSVSGTGYDDPVEAYEANSVDMTCNIVEWNANDIGSGFDGPYHFSVSPGELTFEANPDGPKTLDIYTDYPGGWMAKVCNAAGVELSGAAKWLTLSPSSGTGSAINISAPNYENYDTDRTVYIHITVGERITQKVKVTQKKYVWVHRSADILYWDSGSNTLRVGHWGLEQDGVTYGPVNSTNMMFTKFGGVVGFTNALNETFNASTSIKFDPTGEVTSYGTETNDTENNLPNVPALLMTQYAGGHGVRNVSLGALNDTHYPASGVAEAYHTLDNVRVGRGDICRLVGMTKADIDGMNSDADLYAKETQLASQGIGGWRLPTTRENYRFVGYADWETRTISSSDRHSDSSNKYFVSSITTPVSYPQVNAGDRQYGGYFPTGTSSMWSADSFFLPALGGRTEDGSNTNQIILGYYWSSNTSNNYLTTAYADHMYMLNISVYPSRSSLFSVGNAVRCVRP